VRRTLKSLSVEELRRGPSSLYRFIALSDP